MSSFIIVQVKTIWVKEEATASLYRSHNATTERKCSPMIWLHDTLLLYTHSAVYVTGRLYCLTTLRWSGDKILSSHIIMFLINCWLKDLYVDCCCPRSYVNTRYVCICVHFMNLAFFYFKGEKKDSQISKHNKQQWINEYSNLMISIT